METSQRPQILLGLEEIAADVVYIWIRKSHLIFPTGLSHIRKDEESHSDIRKHL